VRRLLPAMAALACLALAAGALAASGGGGNDAARASALRSSGSLTLTNSREGLAIFNAPDLGPGHYTSGLVTIGNTGTLPGSLKVAATDLQDTPGAGGGALSQRMRLIISDATLTPFTVYNGPLATMSPVGLGTLRSGQVRKFKFTAWLPHGAGDNAYQGSSMSVGYRWTATETELPAPPPVRPAAHDNRPPHCTLTVPRRQRPLRRRRLVVRLRCDERSRLTVYVWVKNRRGKRRFLYGARHRLLPAGRPLRIVLRLPWAPRAIIRSRRHPAVRVAAIAWDGSGNRTDLNRRVRLRH
jgi:spore coat-associated protein N